VPSAKMITMIEEAEDQAHFYEGPVEPAADWRQTDIPGKSWSHLIFCQLSEYPDFL